MFKAEIIEASRTLTPKEKVMYKDTINAIRLDDATRDGTQVYITVADWVKLKVDNDKSEDGTYNQLVVISTDGTKYVTGSKSFENAFMNISSEMAGENFEIAVLRLPSKNYKGKDFISCTLI